MDETVSNIRIEIGASSDEARRQIDRVVSSLRNLRGNSNHSIRVDSKDVDKARDKVGKLANILNSLKRIAFYRVIRSAIKAVGEAFSQGAENAYWYSKTIGDQTKYIADAYDSLSGKSFTMSNQLGAAWATLKATITPILIQIINLVTAAANAITQLFAVLGGRGTYLKAIDYSKDWADTTKAGAGAAKEWKNQLLGFDEINRLEEPSSGGGGGGAAMPDYENMFEEAKVSEFLEKIAAKFRELKDSLDFEPIRKAIEALKTSLTNLGEVILKGLGWAWDNVLVPLAHWTIEEAVPKAIELLAAAFDFLRAVLEKLAPIFEWIWDNILSPLAEWTGDLFIAALETIADLFHDLTDLLDGNMTFSEFLDQLTPAESILLAVATAVIAVNTALGLFNAVAGIVSVVSGVLSGAFAFLTSPIGLVIVAIAALIEIGILLYQHWDEISAWLKKTWETIKQNATRIFGDLWEGIKLIWDGIKTTFKGVIDFVVGIFTGDWERAWNGIANIFTGAIGIVIGAIQTVYGWFKGLIQACADAISWLKGVWDGLNAIGNSRGSSIEMDGSIYLQGFASGGFPDEGQLFLARESGPELVGTMGGRTAVANNSEITEGIRQGVYEAVSAAMGNGNQEVSVRVYLDSREIKSGQNRLNRAMGVV